MEREFAAMLAQGMQRESLSRRELVERMGYRNINKGMRLLIGWLRDGALPTPDQVARIAAALAIDAPDVEAVAKRDAQRWVARTRRHRAQDPHHYLTVRYMPAVYATSRLGAHLSEAEAIEHARQLARDRKLRCWLEVSSGSTYAFDQQGESAGVADVPMRPAMRIGAARFTMHVDDHGVGHGTG